MRVSSNTTPTTTLDQPNSNQVSPRGTFRELKEIKINYRAPCSVFSRERWGRAVGREEDLTRYSAYLCSGDGMGIGREREGGIEK